MTINELKIGDLLKLKTDGPSIDQTVGANLYGGFTLFRFIGFDKTKLVCLRPVPEGKRISVAPIDFIRNFDRCGLKLVGTRNRAE